MAIELTDKITAATTDQVIADANQIAGGYMAITSAQRAQLTEALKIEGTTVYETDTGKTYKYVSNDWKLCDESVVNISAGSYRKVTVNESGRVTSGDNSVTSLAEGGTGGSTLDEAKDNLGIKAVENDITELQGNIEDINERMESLSDLSGTLYWEEF